MDEGTHAEARAWRHLAGKRLRFHAAPQTMRTVRRLLPIALAERRCIRQSLATPGFGPFPAAPDAGGGEALPD
ncbi:hypothetical protein MUU77_11190 [Pseudoxanthomonas sp. F37]|uniref:hypothetical protein n=1 Tax=Pseudoxanthomonas TaxID=83618 RepID=UPI001FD51FA1|nr:MULTISPECIES: hypothetical protein [Pseudoxanthomonas]UOV05843.1 hypothetical protein MUU75_03820 [Pseudoxanthomonas mexicana]UOV07434.1 hypothetical protein MUU77_11190 [Pseudoxanthomonas sp. F37]